MIRDPDSRDECEYPLSGYEFDPTQVEHVEGLDRRSHTLGSTAKVRQLTAELAEAQETIRNLTATERTLTCVYCGKAYPPGTPAHGSSVLTEHIKACTKHPLRQAERKLDRQYALLAWVYDALVQGEGEEPSALFKALHHEFRGEPWVEGAGPVVPQLVEGYRYSPAETLALKFTWLYVTENSLMGTFEQECARIHLPRTAGIAMSLNRSDDPKYPKPEIDPAVSVTVPTWGVLFHECLEVLAHTEYLVRVRHSSMNGIREGVLATIERLRVGDDPREPW